MPRISAGIPLSKGNFMNEQNQNLISSAAIFCQKGLSVVVCHGIDSNNKCTSGETKSPGKKPLDKDTSERNNIKSAEQLKSFLNDEVPYNVAVQIKPESRIIVIDVDKKNGGLESFTKLVEQYGGLPPTLRTNTGGGGFHLYFALPEQHEDTKFPNSIVGFEGIDILRNQKMMIPGSKHYSGNYYTFDECSKDLNYEIQPLPEEYINVLASSADAKKKKFTQIKEGGRNIKLYKVAASLFAKGASEELVTEKLLLTNSTECDPPLEHNEVLGIIASSKKKMNNPMDDYIFDGGNTVHIPNGELSNARIIANFQAILAEQIEVDDGSAFPKEVLYKIEILSPKLQRNTILVTPAELDEGSWVARMDGSLSVIGAKNYREHLKTAIRSLGNVNNRKKVYITLGWVDVDNKPYYLANNGAIGANGFTDTLRTSEEHGGPSGYEVSVPDSADELKAIYSKVSDLVAITDKQITTTLLAAVFRTPLIKYLPTDFCLGIFGITGSMKSTIAALFANFFGSSFSHYSLPESFGSTQNAIERRAFLTQSSFLVIDDWVPGESSKSKADYILRSHGNRQGRGRMNADTSLKKTYFPRSFTVLTGEDIQVEQSLRARMIILQMNQNSIDRKLLSKLQASGERGDFNKFLGSYVQWVIQQSDINADTIKERFNSLRDDFSENTKHGRIAPNLAHLMIGIEVYVRFCTAKELMNLNEAEEFLRESKEYLLSLVKIQNAHQEMTDPVMRFLDCLQMVLSKREAHIKVANPNALGISATSLLGYKYNSYDKSYVSCGESIGEIVGQELRLKKSAAFGAARAFGVKRSMIISLSEDGMGKRLEAKGLTLTDKGHHTAKRQIDGQRERCWVFPNWRAVLDPDYVEAPTPMKLSFVDPKSAIEITMSEASAPYAPPANSSVLLASSEELQKRESDGTTGNTNLH